MQVLSPRNKTENCYGLVCISLVLQERVRDLGRVINRSWIVSSSGLNNRLLLSDFN